MTGLPREPEVLLGEKLTQASRIVIKIGSRLLVHPDTGMLHEHWLDALADDIAAFRARDQDVIVVSSGAIALGRRELALPPGTLRLEVSQAAAAVGQIRLAHAYHEVLGRRGVRVAQMLLTIDDSENRRRYLNARSTLNTLLRLGTVAVINENDTVATAEIRYGDNDRLAARVAQMMSADCLVLLSDIGGLYSADPRVDAAADLVPEVAEIDDAIEAMAGRAGSDDGSGGMVTKIAAAGIAHSAGCHVVIADGRVNRPLTAIEDGAECTWFVPSETPRAARKQWIAGSLEPTGALTVDAGAARALNVGKSLLPAGVTTVDGDFQRGDAVVVKGPDGEAIGRGLCAYSMRDAQRIMGHKSREIEELLGYRGRDEMIHRDDLVLQRERPSRAGTSGRAGKN